MSTEMAGDRDGCLLSPVGNGNSQPKFENFNRGFVAQGFSFFVREKERQEQQYEVPVWRRNQATHSKHLYYYSYVFPM